MNYTNKGRKQGTKRENRKTRYGRAITTDRHYSAPALPAKAPYSAPGLTGNVAPTYSTPKFAPVSDEVTVYGAKKFRTPFAKDEFTGLQGSAIPAYVLDIDGTLQTYGSGADTKVLDWCKKIYEDDPHAVFLVITARDHGTFGYETSFNWLMHHFPYPFIGPFARPKDDPRYASEFKRELAQGFEDMGLYQILGAADDNKFVLDMWDQWAIDHFEDPKDFSVLRCSYGSYAGWRNDPPSKGATKTYPSSSSYTSTHVEEHWDKSTQKWESNFRPGEEWRSGYWDKEQKRFVEGRWVPTATTDGKHRAAGASRYEVKDISSDPAWQKYFAAREAKAAYLPGTEPVDADEQELADILAQIDADAGSDGYSLYRADLEAMVRHDYPGYSDEDLADMSIEDLRENAGITGAWSAQERTAYDSRYMDEDVPLFSDEQLGLEDESPYEFTEGQRRNRVTYRLDLEDDVYSEFPDLSILEIQNMDLTELELLMDTADAARRSDDARVTTAAPDGGPDTAPLDVAEVLRNLDTCAECGLGEDLHKLTCSRPDLRHTQVVAGSAKQGVA